MRTRHIVERFLPPPPAVVLDIGGAAGPYAVWLSQRQYDVYLIEPVQRLVREAVRRSRVLGGGRLSSCIVGDARDVPVRSDTADLVLFLGPLYHLTSRQDRLRALQEAARVLKPGGRVVAAVISRWASAFDGLARDFFADPDFVKIVNRDVEDGQHRNP